MYVKYLLHVNVNVSSYNIALALQIYHESMIFLVLYCSALPASVTGTGTHNVLLPVLCENRYYIHPDIQLLLPLPTKVKLAGKIPIKIIIRNFRF